MAELPQPVDLWSVLDEAEHTVELWPAWQQAYAADVYGDDPSGAEHTASGEVQSASATTVER
jgi:hypothetical protein